MLDESILHEQCKRLKSSFPGLDLRKDADGLWLIEGTLHFLAEYDGTLIDDDYLVRVGISDFYPDEPPKAWETGNRIPRNFHRYVDGSLCLGAPLAVRKKFAEDRSLLGFVRNCLIPYLYAFSYHTKYGEMPFGELAHEGWGILEYYQEIFEVKESQRVIGLLRILAEDSYNENSPCPCGNGKRLGSCHGATLLQLTELQPQTAFQKDFERLVNSLVGVTGHYPPRSSEFVRKIMEMKGL